MSHDSSVAYSANSEPPTPRRASRRSPIPFLIAWIVIVGGGITGAWYYTQHIQQELALQIQQQTDQQMADMQKDYNSRLDKLEQDYRAELSELNSKVQSLNELLTFARDNASNKTDNSNKLFSQLNDVQKQLNELKKNLDVLK